MAKLSDAHLTDILDKLARYAGEAIGSTVLSGGFNAGFELAATDVLSGAGAIDTLIGTFADLQQEADLLPAALALDEKHPAIGSTVLISIPEIAALFTALDKHYKRFGYTTVDAYLTTLNGALGMTAGLRAHGFLKDFFGKYSAHNVFIPEDQVVATFNMTGATTGALVAGTPISKTHYAGAKLVAKNNGAINSSAVLTVTGKKVDGTSGTLIATLTTHTDNFETDFDVTTQNFIDVTAVTVATGTNLDSVQIVAKTDRDVSAA
jgi:hypothetical protein